MAVNTKRALTESLLKLLHTKRFDKITISEITNGCGMNRMTFYYHFSDIYDLMVWCIENYLRGLSRARRDSKDWKSAFTDMLHKTEEYLLVSLQPLQVRQAGLPGKTPLWKVMLCPE